MSLRVSCFKGKRLKVGLEEKIMFIHDQISRIEQDIEQNPVKGIAGWLTAVLVWVFAVQVWVRVLSYIFG